jgi:hypothetical protein
MGWRDKVDVVASKLLQMEHHPRQLIRGSFLTFAQMADLVILAEKAEEIAMTEENGPRSPCSDQRVFFAKMGAAAGNHGPQACSAKPFLVSLPVYLALPWAELAGFQAALSFRRAILQDSFCMQVQVGGAKTCFFFLRHASNPILPILGRDGGLGSGRVLLFH